jgi:hypothetical protein
MAPEGEGVGAQHLRHIPGRRVSMNPHVAEVLPEALLHRGPYRRIERLSGITVVPLQVEARMQQGIHCSVTGKPLQCEEGNDQAVA